MQHWIRPEILALQAYHVPNAVGYIKLDAMENPYRWDEATREAWLAILHEVAINRYPDPTAPALQAKLRETMHIPADTSLVLGNGSDELIQMLALAVGGAGHSVLALEPSFVMYRMIAQITGLRYVGVPLRAADFSLDLPAVLAAIEVHQPALVFLAYPNNPTGNLFDRAAIEAILRAAPGLVVLDEAYAPFAADSFMSVAGHYENLLVMRTLSKAGLAGLRLGFMVGPAAWLNQVEKTRLPYNINVLTQATAEFALARYPLLAAQTQQICVDREQLLAALAATPGVQVWPSQANFLLFRVAEAESVFAQLKARQVLIKKLHGSHPLLDNCLRVTVGTPAENQAFLAALQASLG